MLKNDYLNVHTDSEHNVNDVLTLGVYDNFLHSLCSQ